MKREYFDGLVEEVLGRLKGLGRVSRIVTKPCKASKKARSPNLVGALFEGEVDGRPRRILIEISYQRDRVDDEQLKRLSVQAAEAGAAKAVVLSARGSSKFSPKRASATQPPCVVLPVENVIDSSDDSDRLWALAFGEFEPEEWHQP